MQRLFFAFKLHVATAGNIVSSASLLQKNLQLRGRSLTPVRLRITLHLLGDVPYVPRQIVAIASRVASEVVRLPSLSALDVAIELATSFARERGASPFAAQVGLVKAALTQFWMTLNEVLWHTGLLARPRPPSRFTPHVTLMYSDPVSGTQPIDPIGCPAGELVLVHNLIGRTQHVTINGRFATNDLSNCLGNSAFR